MTAHLHRPHRLLREVHRQELLEAAHNTDLLTVVDIYSAHRVGLRRTAWSDYWSHWAPVADRTLQEQIEALGSARARYISSGFAIEQAAESGLRRRRFDLILLCRVLNNLSTFSIEQTSAPDEIRQLAGRHAQPKLENFHLPHQCLAPPAPAPEHLLASNGQFRLRGGTTCRQLSLTDYFRALHLLQHPN